MLSGFELYPRWVPLLQWVSASRFRFLGNEKSGFDICRRKLRTKQALLLTTGAQTKGLKRIITIE